MDPDPSQDTVPTPAVRAVPQSRLARFIRSVPGAFLILILSLGTILVLAAAAGYYTGSSDRERVASTAQAAELGRQYQLGLEDLSAGRATLAIQRFEFILALDSKYPGAADRLAEARAAVPQSSATLDVATPLPSPTPLITVGPETAKNLLDAAQAAFDKSNWDDALQKLGALRAIDPNYEIGTVRTLQFQALQNRGIDSIKAGKLELGLADLDQASKIGNLSDDAKQYQQWAEIYIAGVSYWGLNWSRTVDTFQLLYTIAPYFRDTITRLHDARVAYGRQLEAIGQPCDAIFQYDEALKLQPDQTVQDRRDAANLACQFGTATPDGTLTQFPTSTGEATSEVEATATFTTVALVGASATNTVAPTNTNAPAATATSVPPSATSAPSDTPTPTTAPANTDTPEPTATQ
jgi:tetratricopeptide (TPR) repeat protein